jgi:ribosomal protein L27
MPYLSAAKAIGVTKSLARLALGASSYASRVAGPTIQVRTATKKVAGSKTNMRDSAGRRLGAKAAENEPVKPGQILMRQRGTRFYPGENADIGKDHTIFALEPGYVRFYLDPFHPKRKFIGVALRPELRLPTDHFAPRVRRLGYVPIEDSEKAAFEEKNLSRKDHLLKPTILKQLQERESARLSLLEKYSQQLSILVPSLSDAELQTASQRLISMKNLLRSGVSLGDAETTTSLIYFQNLKLENKKASIEEAEFEKLKSEYQTLSETLSKSVSFDSKYNLINFTTEEERVHKVQEIKEELQSLFEQSKGQETINQIKKIITENTLLNAKEEKYLTEKFANKLEAALKRSKSKGKPEPFVFKRWNYETKRVESIGA